MPYRLGIDVGTTFTAAAICRPGPDDAVHSELVPLGTRSTSVPSVLFLDEDTVVVGEAAERRALTDPELVVRDFKRRMGDATPIMVGDRPYHAHDLVALLTRWVLDRVTEREGEPPDATTITYPAAWGPHRESLLRSALADVEIDATLMTEPQAAAVRYASAERVEPGSTIAVYDLGGGTFDAVVVRKTVDGDFELLGPADGIDELGGIDIDDAVLDRVLADLPEPEDPVVMARLRRDCTDAKEALSDDTEATVSVLMPRTQVRLTRAEFDTLARPILEQTVRSLQRAIEAAGITAADLTSVLLVGGSSRIPLVSTLITTELGRPVAMDADPKGVVALGAALGLHREAASVEIPGPRRPDHDTTPPDLRRPRPRLRRTKIVLGTLAMLLLALAVLPSPFSTKSGTPPAARSDQPAGVAEAPGTPGPGSTAGSTKKRTPGQPAAPDRPANTKDSTNSPPPPAAPSPGVVPPGAPQPVAAQQVPAATPNDGTTAPPLAPTTQPAAPPPQPTSEAPPPTTVAAAPPPPTVESTSAPAPPPPSVAPSPPPATDPPSNPPTS